MLGIREFRCGITTHFEEDLIEWYDRGREFAHILTFRLFEP